MCKNVAIHHNNQNFHNPQPRRKRQFSQAVNVPVSLSSFRLILRRVAIYLSLLGRTSLSLSFESLSINRVRCHTTRSRARPATNCVVLPASAAPFSHYQDPGRHDNKSNGLTFFDNFVSKNKQQMKNSTSTICSTYHDFTDDDQMSTTTTNFFDRKRRNVFLFQPNHKKVRVNPRIEKKNGNYKLNKPHHRGNDKNNDTNSAAEFNRWLQQLIKTANPSQLQRAEEALWKRIRAAEQEQESSSVSSSIYNTVSFNIILNGWARQRSSYAARKADELLHKLLQLQSSSSPSHASHHKHLQADSYSYAAVLNAYAKSGGGKEAALRAEELLMQMQTTVRRTNSVTKEANSNSKTSGSSSSSSSSSADFCHNAVMDAWSASGDPQAGERAEVWLRKFDPPTRMSYNMCIKAYARSQAPMQAQRLLEEMQSLANSHPQLEPDKISISTCIDAWSKWNKNLTHAALQAEALLQKMEHDFEVWNTTRSSSYHNDKSTSNKQPDIVTYTAVLTAYARSGLPEGPEKALDLIRRMERYSDEKPNAPFFNTFIHLLAKGKSPTKTSNRITKNNKTPEEVAEAILKHMKHQFQDTLNDDIRPCKITYTAVIAVYAAHCSHAQGPIAAAERAEELLNELEMMYNQTGVQEYLPNYKTFGAALSVWAKAAAELSKSSSTTSSQSYYDDDDDGAEATTGNFIWQRAESLMERMEQLYHRTRCEELKPTTIFYSQAFRILANGRDPNAATYGLRLMKKIKDMATNKTDNNGYGEHIYLDSTMYAYLIVTFTKSQVDNGIEVATQILRDVEDGYKAGIGYMKPTSLLYSAVLQAYAKSASKEGAILAEELLEKTKTMYKQGKLYAKPTTLFYNAVVDAQARSGGGLEAAERAEALLDEMEARGRAGDPELCLTTRSFNAAILAWKNSDATDAPQRAEALLKRMTKLYKAGDERCRPDRVTINSIIGVWAQSAEEGAAARAEQFLHFMENLHKTGDPIQPDNYSYNTVIAAYSRSSEKDAARRCQDLYERMKALHEAAGEKDLRPDLITLTSLRRAWMESDDEGRQIFLRRAEEAILHEVALQKKIKLAFSTTVDT